MRINLEDIIDFPKEPSKEFPEDKLLGEIEFYKNSYCLKKHIYYKHKDKIIGDLEISEREIEHCWYCDNCGSEFFISKKIPSLSGLEYFKTVNFRINK